METKNNKLRYYLVRYWSIDHDEETSKFHQFVMKCKSKYKLKTAEDHLYNIWEIDEEQKTNGKKIYITEYREEISFVKPFKEIKKSEYEVLKRFL